MALRGGVCSLLCNSLVHSAVNPCAPKAHGTLDISAQGYKDSPSGSGEPYSDQEHELVKINTANVYLAPSAIFIFLITSLNVM